MTKQSVAAHQGRIAGARKSGRPRPTPQCGACFMLVSIPCGRLKSEQREEYGDIEQLEREVRALKRRAYRLLRLSPLLGNADYRPVAQGMSAALPYVDELLPVHSLARVGRTLIKLARG